MWRSRPFVKAYRPGVVTVGMGGNDIGFADIILRCVSPLNKVWKPEVNEPNCYAAQEDRLGAQTDHRRSFFRLGGAV